MAAICRLTNSSVKIYGIGSNQFIEDLVYQQDIKLINILLSGNLDSIEFDEKGIVNKFLENEYFLYQD